MDRIWALALAFLLAGCTRNGPKSPLAEKSQGIFGVAVETGDHLCFSIQNSGLQPNSLVTLVTPTEPQSLNQAAVVGPSAAACPGVRNDTPAPMNYELHLVSGKVAENLPLIGVLGGSGQFTSSVSPVQATLVGYGQPLMFRACTSADGVHLTSWQGTPLKGTRVWHQYYYLGQDLEPTCTSSDTAP